MTTQPSMSGANRLRIDLPFALMYGAISALAIVLPVALGSLNLPFIANTYGHNYQIFELFGFTASIAILLIGTIQWKRNRVRSPYDIAFVVIPILVNFFFLTLITEYSSKSWDYRCYESAARALLKGVNPYEKSCYLYPPLVAQLMGLGYRLLFWTTAHIGSTINIEDRVWYYVFYVFQCLQLLMVNLVFFLSYRFGRKLHIPKLEALIVVATLLVFNSPVFRTVRHGQVNFYVVSLILLSAMSMLTFPFVSGLLVALGAHLKLYPLVIAIPAMLVRSWRTLLGIAAGIVAVAFVQTSFGQDWLVWRQFLALASSFPRGTAFRDNSLHSVLFNSIKFGSQLTGIPSDKTAAIVSVAVTGASLAVLLWFCLRFYRREQVYSLTVSQQDSSFDLQDVQFFRVSGHIVDCAALMLLISPMVWEHHYVLALPLAVWAVAMQGSSRPWPLAIALILMFAVPTFDFFPFSYHRLVGLFILIIVASPRQILPSPARLASLQQPPTP